MNQATHNQRLKEATTHHLAGRLAPAAAIYDELLRTAPRDFQLLHLRGALAFQRGAPAEAITLLTRALKQKPASAPTLMCLGLAESAVGERTLAERHLRAAIKADVRDAEAWLNLGALLVVTSRLAEAITCYDRALAIKPDYVDAITGLGSTLLLLGRNEEAASAHTRALALNPKHPLAHFCRAQAFLACNRVPEALADFDRQLALNPDHHESRSYRLLTLNYLDTVTAEQLYVEHRRFGQRVEGALPPLTHRVCATSDRDPERRLRVAFLSPDLRSHSVAYFLEPLLRHLDRERFEIVLYHDHFTVDAASERLRAHASLWRNFVGLSSCVVEKHIRADSPDILVDLAGHTGFNRLPLFARRLAPVQLSYLGYPNTTGLAAMDFRFTDSSADPRGLADRLHSEKLVRFSPCAWAYDPPASAPPVPPAPSSSLHDRPFAFGSFNNLSKVTASTLRLWAQVVGAVAGSVLILKGSGLDPARLHPMLAAAGFKPEQVRLLPLCPGTAEHLACYGEIDVALDPFPYNGTTTTCEALWMGRPVVALAGERHAARVGASLLSAIGHPEWVAQSPDDYVRIALALASDRPALARASLALRDDLRRSPLLDHSAQASRFAGALRACWRERMAAPMQCAPLHSAA